MSTYAAVESVMAAIQAMLTEGLPPELTVPAIGATVALFGGQDFKQTPAGNVLALYLYRISIDPTIPGGYVRNLPGAVGRTPEVPVMLHFLMISFGQTAQAEIALAGWGFAQLATTPIIGSDRMAAQVLALQPPGQTTATLGWDDADEVQVATEELTREELMRIWDTLPLKYCLTVPYVARGVRVALKPNMRQYAPVADRTLAFGPAA